MSHLQIFENERFGRVRTIEQNGEPWFIARDVCECLSIGKYRDAVSRLEEDERGSVEMDTPGGRQGMTAINEYGLYSLVLSSRKPEAKEFKRWITHDVIPAIRKTGGYIAHSKDMTDEEIMAKALLVAQKTITEKQKQIRRLQEDKEKALQQIETDRPKVIFANAVSASKTSILVGELAKILRGNNIQIGQRRLFQWLRENGYLIRRTGSEYNMPTQYAMELGLFEIREGSYIDGGGVNHITKTAKITGKGQTYFINKFLNKRKAE